MDLEVLETGLVPTPMMLQRRRWKSLAPHVAVPLHRLPMAVTELLGLKQLVLWLWRWIWMELWSHASWWRKPMMLCARRWCWLKEREWRVRIFHPLHLAQKMLLPPASPLLSQSQLLTEHAHPIPVDVDSSPRHAPEPDHAPEPTPSEVLIPEVGKPCRGRNAKAKASSAKAKKAANPKSSPKKKAAPKSLPKSRATRKAAAPKAATKAKVKAMGKGRAKKTKRSAEDAEMGDAALASENVEMGPEATETVEGGVATTAEMGAGLAVEARETADSTVHMPARAGMAEMAENTETPEATEHRYANGMTEKEVARKMHSASWRQF